MDRSVEVAPKAPWRSCLFGMGEDWCAIDVDILDVGTDLKCDFDLEDLEKVGVLAVYCMF